MSFIEEVGVYLRFEKPVSKISKFIPFVPAGQTLRTCELAKVSGYDFAFNEFSDAQDPLIVLTFADGEKVSVIDDHTFLSENCTLFLCGSGLLPNEKDLNIFNNLDVDKEFLFNF